MYTKKIQRYDKYFESDKLVEENFYQRENVFLAISGQKSDAGKVILCTKNIEKMLGGEVRSYEASRISSLFLPRSETFHDEFFQATVNGENPSSSSISNFGRKYAYHKEGYLIQVDYYINICPFITRGFYLNLIMREVPTGNDFMIINENGNIEGVSKDLSKKLGILTGNVTQQMTHVNQISSELDKINTAFNFMSQTGAVDNEKPVRRFNGFHSVKTTNTLNESSQKGDENPNKTNHSSIGNISTKKHRS